ncbi:MAG: toprim domain-containing protein [Pseudomonadota bacterium]
MGLESAGMNTPEMANEHTDRFLGTDALEELRRTSDWKVLLNQLGLSIDERRSKADDWWMSSPFSDDTTPSFHVKPDKGVWYCFSTRNGGGIIELVQRLHGLNCFQAGDWLIDHGVAPEPDGVQVRPKQGSEPTDDDRTNTPVRQSLLPALSEHGTHDEFMRRGIGEKTCRYLGCGYLAKGRSRLKGRIVFQVRGVELADDGLAPVILTHLGRAVDANEAEAQGRWLTYKGFRKAAELYNIDKLLIDPVAREQVRLTGRVLIVEGPFDVAKLVEAGIFNVVATMGAGLSEDVRSRLDLIASECDKPEFLVWFDRDQAGVVGQNSTLELLADWGFKARGFDWSIRFGDRQISIADAIQDPCDMSVHQLAWLRRQGLV